MNTEYFNAIKEEVLKLSKLDNSIFLGQQTASEDYYGLLTDIDMKKRIEMPIAEEMQLGISIGLAMEGFLPISIYQRCDFLLRAMDQLVNHLDKTEILTNNIYKSKVIILTTIGSKEPLDSGPQHTQDLTEVFKLSVKFPVLKMSTVEEVKTGFELAKNTDGPILLIVNQGMFNE